MRAQTLPDRSASSSSASARVMAITLKTFFSQCPQKRTRSSPRMARHEAGQGDAIVRSFRSDKGSMVSVP